MEEILGRDVGGRPALVLRGAAMLICGALFVALTTAYTRGVFADAVTVRAIVDNAGGSLISGADVKARGVIVGKTSGIKLTDHGVEVDLVLGKDYAAKIPRDVTARILPATVFGTSFVDLVVPASDSTAALRDGQIVAQDKSAGTLELQTTLDNVYRVVTAVHPAELSTTLAAISQALKGHGNDIGASMTQLESYLARLNPHLPLVQQDIRLLADNLQTLNRNAPDLLAAVDDGLVTARTISAKRAELTTLLTGSAALVDESDRLLTNVEQSLVETIRQSAIVVNTLYDERDGIASGFRAFVRFGKQGSTALSDGPWLNTNARIVTSGGNAYTSADCPRFGTAHGDNCPSATTTGLPVAPMPGIDDALVRQLQAKLAQFDSGGGGIAELLTRPLVGGQWGVNP